MEDRDKPFGAIVAPRQELSAGGEVRTEEVMLASHGVNVDIEGESGLVTGDLADRPVVSGVAPVAQHTEVKPVAAIEPEPVIVTKHVAITEPVVITEKEIESSDTQLGVFKETSSAIVEA
jgi:hypothetical protein